jgi:pimeloyl-ACP methyl ester carboxylesterase
MVDVRGVDLAVTDEGSGEPALCWGHGFGSCVANEEHFMFQWARIADRHRLVRWDARGHGQSTGTDVPADYHWDELALDLVALADALAVGRFVAGGVSMGAATALHTAVAAPDRVAGMLLVLPPTAWETRSEEEYASAADLVEAQGVQAYVDEWNSRPVPEILEPIKEIYSFTPAVPDHLFPSALRGASQSDLPPKETVAAITVPALILAWTTDDGHPLSTAETLYDLLPDSTLHVARDLAAIGPWTDEVITFLDALA